MNPGAKYYCSENMWVKTATKGALAAGVKPAALLSGARDRVHTAIRWRLWGDLIDRNYSFASIGRASGFNHTSVMYGVRMAKAGATPFRLPVTAAIPPDVQLARLRDAALRPGQN